MSCGHCGSNIICVTIRKDPYIGKHICGCGVKIVEEHMEGNYNALRAHLVSKEIPPEYKDKIHTVHTFLDTNLRPCPLQLEEDVWSHLKED